MSDNWVVQNLQNALDTWNKYLTEIWQLITQSPAEFKGGAIWGVILNIHDAIRAVGLALLVLFFLVGVMRTCGSFAEMRRPEVALKLFVRFALAKGGQAYGLELMLVLFQIVQGLVSTILNASGLGAAEDMVLPEEIVTAVEDCGFFESIPLWAVTLIGGLFITVLSFLMILTVYGRFFRLYLYTAIAPVPLSTFAGEPPRMWARAFLKLCRCVLGGGHHCAGLRHFLPVRRRPAGGGCGRCSGHPGVELHWRADFQYAGLSGQCENG